MKTTSTGMPPNDTAATGSAAEPGATRPGATHAAVDGETAPRLPHERDESADAAPPNDERIEKAAADIEAGRQGSDRGEVTDALYARHLRGERGNGRG